LVVERATDVIDTVITVSLIAFVCIVRLLSARVIPVSEPEEMLIAYFHVVVQIFPEPLNSRRVNKFKNAFSLRTLATILVLSSNIKPKSATSLQL
jgi:hypothetical protein